MLELTGHINDQGVLKMPNREMLDDWIRSHANKDVTLSISIKKKKRSSHQNEYYWGCIVPLVQKGLHDLGNDFSKQMTHEFLKANFNKKEIELKEGHWIDSPGSTTELSTIEFMEYIARIQQFAAEMLGIVIPDPSQPFVLFAHHDTDLNTTIVESGNSL
jgi:hypothetical protein